MVMGVVRFMTRFLKEMLQIMGYQVQAHEQEQDAHRKTSKDLGSLQAKWMADTRSLPYFKVPKDIYGHTKKSSE
jgi:hypothetical protein